MTNVTPLGVPDQRRVEELVLKLCDTTQGEPNDVLLAALAEYVTFLTTMEGTENAYDYVVSHARDESGYIYVKRSTPRPDPVVPFKRPEDEKE